MAYSCNACGRWVESGSCDCYRPEPSTTVSGVNFICIDCHADITRFSWRCLPCQVLLDTRLHGEVARLTRERDEARAQADHWREKFAKLETTRGGVAVQ